MKLSYRRRLFLYFAVLFTLFTAGIAVFEHYREANLKTEALEEKLDIYTHIVQAATEADTLNIADGLRAVQTALPEHLRITIIGLSGNVIYDNTVADFKEMENHANRPEIILAGHLGKARDIRESASTHHKYVYYARKVQDRFIRVALPYNIQLRQFLQADNLFLYFLLGLFLLSVFFIHKITEQFGASVRSLRDFAVSAETDERAFSDDEIGEIGRQISQNYQQLELSKKKLQLEKQKLLQHIQISEEGICFISSSGEVEFYNNLFIQYLNQLTEVPVVHASNVLSMHIFDPLRTFLDTGEGNYFETRLSGNGKIFSQRTTVFEDKSFEIILTDITRQEKTRRLKQEMTGNIAHELRTPVTSIRAYLETILEQPLSDEQKLHFIRQAYSGTLTLSEMIKDMSILSKLEEAPHSFEYEAVDIESLLSQIREDESERLQVRNIRFDWQLPHNISINGNKSLLTSIFRNLVENSIRYAGENISIHISVFDEDAEFYHFVYYDTGTGIENEAMLNRIFERFYRIQEGRSRDAGGSGLGLSIVRNAVLFHKGSILAKNRKGGGLEFIFKLHR